MQPEDHADRDAKVLEYGDVVLRAGDMALLQGPHWLNDQIIALYFEYAAAEKFVELCSAGRVLLLPPAITFLLSMCGPSGAADLLQPLKVHNKDLIFFAVNDNEDGEEAGGGTHWTLLLYCRPADCYRHYDSAPSSSSRAAAKRLYDAVHDILSPGGTCCPLVEVEGMPRQQNGYDCGVYVLAAADEALAMVASGQALDMEVLDQHLRQTLTPGAIEEFRSRLFQLIHSLRQREKDAGIIT